MYDKISDNSLLSYCQERYCSQKATHSVIKIIAGMETIMWFCKEHAEQFTDWFSIERINKECENKEIVKKTKHEFELDRFFHKLEQKGYAEL